MLNTENAGVDGSIWIREQCLASHLALSCLGMIAMLIVYLKMRRMKVLPSKQQTRAVNRDRALLGLCCTFLIFYKVLTLAVGIIRSDAPIVLEGLVTMVHAVLFVIFVNGALVYKRPAYVRQW